MNRNQCIIVPSSHKVQLDDDEHQRSRFNRIVVVILLLSSLVLIKCISINNAFPFEMMQIYSKPEEEPRRGSNNQNNYMSTRGNFQPNHRQDTFRSSYNQPHHPSPAMASHSSIRSTTPRPLLPPPPVTSWSTSTTSSTQTTTSTTTTTMKPTTKKVRRIKLPKSFSSSKVPTIQVVTEKSAKKDDEDTNKIIDQVKGSKKVPKPQEELAGGGKTMGEEKGKKMKEEKKKVSKGKSHTVSSGGKNEEGKVDEKVAGNATKYEPEFDSKVVKVTNYEGKKKKWIIFPSKESVMVETRSGKVEGMKGNVMNHEVNAFLGIPYAAPPLDSLRFRKTASVKPWNGIYNATNFKPHCMQTFEQDITLARTLTTLDMSEDCLYLNIWTPSLKPEKPKTVMIWIYGGGFKSGSANYDETDGRVLSALGNVVVVTFNYRIGAFGFLDTQTQDSPGNQGLYDAVEAISWVRDNVKSFGGDPNDITLFGHYSGAVMIGLFMVSESTKYWFKRAILQSGSPLFQDFFDGKNSKTSELLIEKIGCQDEERRMEMRCIRNKTAEEVVDAQTSLLAGDRNLFAPTHCEDLIPTTVIDAIKSSSPEDQMSNQFFSGIDSLLMGSNKDELSVSLVMGFPEMFTTKRVELNLTTLSELRELVVEIFTRGNSGSTFSGMNEAKFVTFLAELFFTQGQEVDTTDNLIKRMYRVFGDAAVACPVTIFGEHLFKMGKTVYLYEFNQRAFNTPWGDWMGVAFSTEIPYIFGHPLRYPKLYSKDDLVISRRMIQTWSMFAKTGEVPLQKNVTWEPFSDSLRDFIEINPHHVRVGTRDKNEVCNLFRVTIQGANSSSLNCTDRSEEETEVDVGFTETEVGGDERGESTTREEELRTEEPTEPPIIACELFTFSDPREPSVEYIQYEVIHFQIVPILNTSAVFHCDEGEELVGDQVSRCTEDGSWTSLKPTCRRVVYPKGVIPSSSIPRFTCDLFKVPDHPLGPVITYENYVLMNDTDIYATQGTIARFTCKTQGNDLVKLFGSPTITCAKYGIWDSIQPECKVVDETKEIKIIEKDIKNQLVIIGLILLVVIAIVYVTFTLYMELDKRGKDERPITMQSLTPDSNQGYYYNRGRVSDNSLCRETELEQRENVLLRMNYNRGRVGDSILDHETELEPREDDVLLRMNEEFNEGSEISPEDMEIIDILAKARDGSIVSGSGSKRFDRNMNIINPRRSSRLSRRKSSRMSSRLTKSSVISDGDGRRSSRSTMTEITRCDTRTSSGGTSSKSIMTEITRCDTRTSGGGTSSSEPETVLWVYR